jgi:hypothetical protein
MKFRAGGCYWSQGQFRDKASPLPLLQQTPIKNLPGSWSMRPSWLTHLEQTSEYQLNSIRSAGRSWGQRAWRAAPECSKPTMQWQLDSLRPRRTLADRWA